VIIVAKARTSSLAACKAGQRFRMALSLGCASSLRVSRRRQSQFVTSRTLGGASPSGGFSGRMRLR
jgi:hypothetical protein